MKIELTPEQAADKAAFRAFVDAEIFRQADRFDREESIPPALIRKIDRDSTASERTVITQRKLPVQQENALEREAYLVVIYGEDLGRRIALGENAIEAGRLSTIANGGLAAKAEEQAALIRGVLTILRQESDATALTRKLRDYLAGKLPDSQIAAQIGQWTSPAFRRNMSADPAPLLRKIACPVLALYAEKDLSTPVKLNLPAMRDALSGNKAAEVEQLPDLNLLFQTADVGIGREANWAEETMSPVVLERIAAWIARR